MDAYYQLLEQDTAKINPTWKGLHIMCLVVAIISGFITAYSLGRAVDAFGDNCILHSKIRFQDENSSQTVYGYHYLPLHVNLTPIDPSRTNWGSDDECYFCQFTPVVAMIFGIFWLAAFIILSKGGAGFITDEVYRPWRIVYPAMLFAAVSTTFILLSTFQLATGVEHFCAQFEPIFGTKHCTIDIDQYTWSFHPYQRRMFVPMTMAVVCSYICLASWLAQLITLIMRVLCVVDFQMIRITVTGKNEELIQVINPDNNETLIYQKDSSSISAPTTPLLPSKEVQSEGLSPSTPRESYLDKIGHAKYVKNAPTADTESLSDDDESKEAKRKVSFKLSKDSLYDPDKTKEIPLHLMNNNSGSRQNGTASNSLTESELRIVSPDQQGTESTASADSSSSGGISSFLSRLIGRK